MHTNWESSSNTPGYDGWDQEIFDGLSSDNTRRSYDLAAYLHHGVPRKDARPYLGHINRSLQKLEQYKHLLGQIKADTMKMLICLHDIIEDDDNGVELIEKEFGIEVLIAVLWMSVPKKRVRDGVARLIKRKPEYSGALKQFTSIHHNVGTLNLEEEGQRDSLELILPVGIWHQQWVDLYRDEYMQKAYGSEERRDIFAKYIFGSMIKNMPEHLFLVKCIERLDNLRDREGLKTPEGLASYQRTVATTIELYCKRLQRMSLEHNDIGYSLLSGLLIAETVIGIEDIQKSVKSSTTKALDE